jgi:TatD DNase family protein
LKNYSRRPRQGRVDSISGKLVDFHCHLDLYPDFEKRVRECEAAEVHTLAVTTTPRAFERNWELTKATRHVRAALGLHPQLVAGHAEDLTEFPRWLDKTRYVGEVGLDAGSQFYRSFSAQERVFAQILGWCSEAGGKILSVHSVRSATRVLDHIERSFPSERGKVVLHWFTGSEAEAKRAIQLGCYFSINVQMLRNPKHSATVACVLPMDRLLTETDGPFVEREGKAIAPGDVTPVLEAIASLRRCDLSRMRAQVHANFQALLQ